MEDRIEALEITPEDLLRLEYTDAVGRHSDSSIIQWIGFLFVEMVVFGTFDKFANPRERYLKGLGHFKIWASVDQCI